MLDFLVRAAREYRRGGWVFTGFHWPVVAGQTAYRLRGNDFTQVFEAGASTHEAAAELPTSTTDYPAYGNALGFTGTTADVLLGMGRRFDRVVLDASNIDVRGCVNSSFVGDLARPTVRLPGGGGAPDIAARARELVWLHGGGDLSRIQARVEHVTAAPGASSLVRLHTRWGVARLGAEPVVEEVAPDVPGHQEWLEHLAGLGVAASGAVERAPVQDDERAAAAHTLRDAARRGYGVARKAVNEIEEER
ncbi:CoA-transferase [Angustibacter sp. Root456]|nr:CoA-transferase [Angustibacter sp. Root456]